MTDLGDLLEALPVPDHNADFWDELTARLTDDDVPIGAAESPAPRRWTRTIVVASVAAAILLVLVFGLQRLTDEDGQAPVITDLTTTTTQPDTEDATPVPGGIEGFSWNLVDGVFDDNPVTVSGNGWVQQFEDNGASVETSSDGRIWEPFPGPADFSSLQGVRIDGDVTLAWGYQGDMISGLTLSLAVTTDRGATWAVSPFVDNLPSPPPAAFFRADRPVVDGTVRNDTVLVISSPTVTFDSTAAVQTAGILPLSPLGLPLSPVSLRPVWGHADPADDYVEICEYDPEADWFEETDWFEGPIPPCLATSEVSLAELGVDRGEFLPRLPQRLLRSVAGGPFEEVPVELGVTARIDPASDRMPDAGRGVRLGVGGGGFFVVSTGAEAPSADVLWSADGQTWETHAFDGSPWTVTGTDTSLFALRGTELIRSDDHGATWSVVPTPGGEVAQVFAGPSSVLLEGVQNDRTGQRVAWSPDGRSFEWVPLRDLVPFDVEPQGTETVILRRAVISEDQIMVTVEHLSTPDNGAIRVKRSPTYVLDSA